MASSSSSHHKQHDNLPPYSLNVHPTDALELVKHGASLLILDMPVETLFGFDLQVLTVGPLFKGIKMIPPGPHFVYYSATGKHGNGQSFFTGFFIHPSPGDVIVRRWDARSEILVKLEDSDEEERYVNAVRKLEFDRHLGAYDIHHHQTWKRLTSHLNAAVIDRFEPVHGDISVIHEADFEDSCNQTLAERRLQQHLKQNKSVFSNKTGKIIKKNENDTNFNDTSMMPVESDVIEMNLDTGSANDTTSGSTGSLTGEASKFETNKSMKSNGVKNPSGRCFYTQFSHLVKTKGLSGTELTMRNVDKTAELESLVNQQYGGCEELLLGELEFSFIAFLMGQSLESFSQWKSLVSLMLSCDEAPLSKHTRLYVQFLDIVCNELQTALKSKPSDQEVSLMDASWFSNNNFLKFCFKEFYRLVSGTHPVDGDLLKQTRKLRSILESSLGWIFDMEDVEDEDDEYAPVVVSEAELVSYS